MGMGKGVWFPTIVPLRFLGGLYRYLERAVASLQVPCRDALRSTQPSADFDFPDWLLRHPIYADEGACPSEKFISSGPKSKMKPQATPCPS